MTSKTEMDRAVDDEIEKLLCFDALAAAEQKTGESYKSDETTMALGLLAHVENTKTKEAVLRAAGDTTLSNHIGDYEEVLRDEGFTEVLALPFNGHDGMSEHLKVWWHETEGLLLRFDTYCIDHVNGASVYYNWIPDAKPYHEYTSSGGMTNVNGELIWNGDHDAREALRFKLRRLRENGRFVSPWKAAPYIWLLHYKDTKGGFDSEKYSRINEERYNMLPQRVRDSLGVTRF